MDAYKDGEERDSLILSGEFNMEHYRGPLTDGNKEYDMCRSRATSTVVQYPQVVLSDRQGVILHDRGGRIIYFVQTGPACWLVSAPPAVARREHVVC